MPMYELFMISKPTLTKAEFANVMKRTATYLMDREAVVQSIQHIGLEPLPYQMTSHRQKYYYGRQWTLTFFANPTLVKPFKQTLDRDANVIRSTIISKGSSLKRYCGL